MNKQTKISERKHIYGKGGKCALPYGSPPQCVRVYECVCLRQEKISCSKMISPEFRTSFRFTRSVLNAVHVCFSMNVHCTHCVSCCSCYLAAIVSISVHCTYTYVYLILNGKVNTSAAHTHALFIYVCINVSRGKDINFLFHLLSKISYFQSSSFLLNKYR